MKDNKLAVLEDKAVKNLNTVLEDLIASGDVKVSELNPSLSALLSDPINGGFPGRVFVGKNVGFREGVPMPSMDDKDEMLPVDVLELKDVTNNFLGNTFNFYARNGGSKAKIQGVKDHEYVLIAFKGEVESENKHFAPYKDYLVLGCNKKEQALIAMEKIEKAVGKSSATGGAALAGKA